MTKKASKRQIIWQIAAAGISMLLILFSLHSFLQYQLMWAAGASSLASTTYLIYAQPSCKSSHPKNILLCYLLAFVVGLLFHCLIQLLSKTSFMPANVFWGRLNDDIIGALAVMVMLAVSIIWLVPHPPASGMALVVALKISSFAFVGVLFWGVIFLALSRYFFRHKLIDLWE